MIKLEKYLEKISKADPDHQNEYLLKFLKTTYMFANLKNGQPCTAKSLNDFKDILFSSQNSAKQQQIIACCLLLLMCANSELVWDNQDFRIKMFSLFDNALTNIYKWLSIVPDDENHIKLTKLLCCEKSFIDDFKDVTKNIASLKTLKRSRGKYMKYLSREPGKTLLDIFVDHSLISEERLDELFEVLDNYYLAKTNDKLAMYNEVLLVIESYLSYARQNDNMFVTACVIDPWSKVIDIIKNDFKSNDAIKPALVIIEETERKYPLHVYNKELLLKIIVRNEGPGFAFEVFFEITDEEGLAVQNKIIYIGQLEVGETERFIRAKVSRSNLENCFIIGNLHWLNYDRSENKHEFLLEFHSQRKDLDWVDLEKFKPYSLEAVETEEELVGRRKIINNLFAKLSSTHLESSIIWGQKRVGKTSIAKTLRSKLNKSNNGPFVAYVPVGQLNKLTNEKFVTTLGENICGILKSYEIFSYVPLPEFKGTLLPLGNFLATLKKIKNDARFVIMVDEFDEIPRDFFLFTPVGETFTHNIRTLSEDKHIAFVFSGGENIQVILDITDRWNKFEAFRVDYFDREKYWHDFTELVERPVKGILEFSKKALQNIYSLSEGNPFFTKFICSKIYTNACETRNAYISDKEVADALDDLLNSIANINVNHFWKDGIFEYEQPKREIIEIQRKKSFLAYSGCKKVKSKVTLDDLLQSDQLKSEAYADKIIEQLVLRQIFIIQNGHYRIKPRLFDLWLTEHGEQKLTGGFLDIEAVEAYKQKNEAAYVGDAEIGQVVSQWGLFRNREINAFHVRSWLNNFADNIEERLMFKLLQNVSFYSEQMIREKLLIIHNKMRRDIPLKLSYRERVRKDIYLSCFGNVNKSGSYYLRVYAHENKIQTSNILSFNDLLIALNEDPTDIAAIFFIDDFIGSGDTAIDHLKILNDRCGDALSNDDFIKVSIGAICGLEEGIQNIRNYALKLNFTTEVNVCDPINRQHICFSNQSPIFESSEERQHAKQVALKYGKKLFKRSPLGYKNGQLLIVFHDNCPDNSLPILWGNANNWTPLFERY